MGRCCDVQAGGWWLRVSCARLDVHFREYLSRKGICVEDTVICREVCSCEEEGFCG
jgi:hypothetical protein